ncbi:hypothetical protein LCGC14_1875660 [marine sediment metagenome]|uniref:Uncharacterized protein n=1 Tax=marine sediment metagenome TaxID=412755 RepID=A0A0F9G3Q1_9ZZZZ
MAKRKSEIKALFEPWPEFIWMIIRHWFWEFKMCEGCKIELRERLHPTQPPEQTT